MTVLNLHFTWKETNLYEKLQAYIIINTFSKVLKKLCTTSAYKQHTDHQTDGFRKGKPNENATFKLTDCVWKSMNQKIACGRNFCDLAKAFDMWIMKFS